MVRRIRPVRFGLLFVLFVMMLGAGGVPQAMAAPYAAMVIDARTGEVLHSANADTRLHPASLTKMMTLYIAFEAVRNGEISLDDKVRISKNAAAEPPSKLGLQAGSSITFRYLIRAAAVKSANDAATAIGEAISGSEAAFARRMNATAKSLGMTRTTFRNAHGLTQEGHLSTARDMTTLGRHLLYDYPEYYNLFSRRSTDAGLRMVNNTNRRFLAAYRGADGIKTGYTRAAGFNLVASAQRGNERIIVTVFGGQSTAQRNSKVAELMDLGFRQAPSDAPLRPPTTPLYAGGGTPDGAFGKSIRVTGLVERSLRPMPRPGAAAPVLVAAVTVEAQRDEAALREGIAAAIATAADMPVAPEVAEEVATQVVEAVALAAVPRPAARPAELVLAVQAARVGQAAPDPEVLGTTDAQEVVTRVSTSGGRHWGINVGRYGSRYAAEKVLLSTALTEMTTLDGALRKVVKGAQGFDAHFLGMTRESADLACRRLQARDISCFMVGPAS